VNVVVFEERVRAAFDRAAPLSPKTLAAVERFAKKQSPGHRGDLLAAMTAALDLEEVDTIFLLTDGAPSFGEIVDQDRVRAAVRRVNRTKKRVIETIGFGSRKPAERRLVTGLARDSGGRAVFR
jgi:ribonuclease D